MATLCGPCKETECEDIADENDEYEALTYLYNRLFDSPATCSCPASDDEEPDVSCECPLLPKRAVDDIPAAAVEYCADRPVGESSIKRADRQLSALLKPRKGNVDEGDVKHLLAQVPKHKSCRNREPGTLNSALFGLDLEHWMAAATGGDGRDDSARRAAYDLAAAEAHCKHPGAVHAAEMAVHIEPAGHLAEVAARFAAQTYTKTHTDGNQTGDDTRDESPVVVVAYVGNTGPAETAAN